MATGYHLPASSLVPHRLRRLRMLKLLWLRKQVAIVTVSGALSAVGMTVALDYEDNPTKAQGEKALVPRLAQMMEGWRKEDPTAKIFSQWELIYQNFWQSWVWIKIPLKW